jgi:hypothetical protein
VKVLLRNPDREVNVTGGRLLHEVLAELGVSVFAVLVIRAGELSPVAVEA